LGGIGGSPSLSFSLLRKERSTGGGGHGREREIEGLLKYLFDIYLI